MLYAVFIGFRLASPPRKVFLLLQNKYNYYSLYKDNMLRSHLRLQFKNFILFMMITYRGHTLGYSSEKSSLYFHTRPNLQFLKIPVKPEKNCTSL